MNAGGMILALANGDALTSVVQQPPRRTPEICGGPSGRAAPDLAIAGVLNPARGQGARRRRNDTELEAFVVDFDFNLADLNNEYYQKRVSRRLEAPRLCVMKKGWAEREKRRAVDLGKRETQFKWQVIRLEWDDENLNEVENYVETRHIPKDA